MLDHSRSGLRAFAVPLTAALAFGFARVDAPPEPPQDSSIVVFGPLSDGAVLQRGRPVAVRGRAAPGAEIVATASWAGPNAAAVGRAAADGAWSVTLPAGEATGPQRIDLRSGATTRAVSDLLFGDVWLCSGQSNMEWPMKQGVRGADEAIRHAVRAGHAVRHAKVARRALAGPAESAKVVWRKLDEASAREWSAVAFHFGVEIAAKTGVPIGLLDVSYGGTPIEAWMRAEALRPFAIGASAADAGPGPTEASASRAASEVSAHAPSSLWNGMLRPVLPTAVCGALWYQGESNLGRAAAYGGLLGAMIDDWRAAFGDPALPFYVAQIAPYAYAGDRGEAATLRAAQEEICRAKARTGLVATADVGDAADIHPRDKETVGKRFAAFALRDAYGKTDVRPEPPRAVRATFAADSVRVSLEFAAGLRPRGAAPPKTFEAAAADGVFVRCDARLDGAEIVIDADLDGPPVAVRHAWGAADEAEFANGAGLPLGPFLIRKG